MVLASRGNRQERAAEKKKQKERDPAKDGPSSPKREGEGRRRKDDDGNAPGLLQLHSLASYLLLQSLSARPGRPHHASRSKFRQQTLCRAFRRLPTLTRPFPRLADLVDEAEERAEAETEDEHSHLRIREASAPP